ncbi:MAG: sugar transferase [Bdellovibrionota bacterium]
MLGREGVSELFGLSLTDAAFSSPDPDDFEIIVREARNARRRSTLESRQLGAYEQVKRTLDIIVSGLLLVTLSPLLLFVACAVKLTSRGPAVYCQKRLTIGGRIFKMYKFRTMREDAEAGIGAVWAQESDPRVTALGKILRKTRIDELPQLINVLQGDMSLIGPRPERPELAVELSRELPEFSKRLAVKGGITGLAQVSSGYASNADSYRDKLLFDLAYIRNRSLMLDLSIAARTVLVMLTGFGAR